MLINHQGFHATKGKNESQEKFKLLSEKDNPFDLYREKDISFILHNATVRNKLKRHINIQVANVLNLK